MDGHLAPAIELLRKDIPGLAGVYLFGSQARGAARPSSDVDLAIFAHREIEPGRLAGAREAIARLLLREVDLVDLAVADAVLQMQVLEDGVLVAADDAAAVGNFELRVLHDYSDLKIRRADIEADIVKRGRVHA